MKASWQHGLCLNSQLLSSFLPKLGTIIREAFINSCWIKIQMQKYILMILLFINSNLNLNYNNLISVIYYQFIITLEIKVIITANSGFLSNRWDCNQQHTSKLLEIDLDFRSQDTWRLPTMQLKCESDSDPNYVFLLD